MRPDMVWLKAPPQAALTPDGLTVTVRDHICAPAIPRSLHD